MAVIFPRWSNKVPLILLTALTFGGVFSVFAVWYWFSPKFTDVGYAPKQPIPFSHKLHAGDLGLDCRYCHYSVEKSSFAAVPPTNVCMGCHQYILPDSPKLALLKAKHESKQALKWVRVHMLPDYAFFDHSVHIAAGVGCATCHGRIDKMEVVRQAQPLSMSWCLDCHRNPNPNLRPRSQVTNMKWDDSPAKKLFAKHLSTCLKDPKNCSSTKLCSKGQKNCYVGEIKQFIARRHDIKKRRKDIVDGKTVKRHSFMGSKEPQSNPKQLAVNPPEHCSGCHR